MVNAIGRSSCRKTAAKPCRGSPPTCQCMLGLLGKHSDAAIHIGILVFL